MSIARRDAKCSSASRRCARQTSPPLHRATASPSARVTWDPHTGQRSGSFTRRAPRGSPVGDDAHDLGYHVAGAPHDDGVADAHVLALELVHVVQRHVAHGDAADEHRLEARDGRERAGAPDLEVDAAHGRGLLLRRELVGDGPARRARDEAEVSLPVEPVDLVDHAVDVVIEAVAQRSDPRVVREAALDAGDRSAPRGRCAGRSRAAPRAPAPWRRGDVQPSVAPTP